MKKKAKVYSKSMFSKGGKSTLKKYGREHFVKLAKKMQTKKRLARAKSSK